MNSTSIGKTAEAAVANSLKDNSYRIIAQNWRTRFCEVDIIAQKQAIVFFYEVKFRSSSSFGGGLEYVTAKKAKQMKFAADFWCTENQWQGDYRLCAVAASLQNGKIIVDEAVELIQ